MSNLFRASLLAGKPPSSFGTKSATETPKPAEPVAAPAAENEEKPNHRWTERHRLVGERAVVRYKDSDHEVELLNLSGGGAMVRGEIGARMWDKLWLVLNDSDNATIECAVRWIRRDRLGLEFAHETQINGDAKSRDVILKGVIRRHFNEPSDEDLPADFGPGPEIEDIAPESQRTDRRHPLIWMAEVPFDHSFQKVRIRNISETGAMVESGVYFPIGTEVMLDMGDAGRHFAKVVWARGDQFGFAFTQPFDLTNLARARASVAPQKWAQPAYLKAEPSKSSPWADHWNRSSLEELREDLGGFLGR